jgi:Protein of unknown function, DUF599
MFFFEPTATLLLQRESGPMEIADPWLSIAASALVLAAYELRQARTARRDPARTARTAHSGLRAQWVKELSRQPGTELLAVQALRNSLMSATITASTAALAWMGAASLFVSGARSALTVAEAGVPTWRFTLELGALATLFVAYVCATMAVRHYHHAGYLMSLPVGSEARTSTEATAVAYVQRAGVLYSWSLRCFFFLAPIAVGIWNPRLILFASAALVGLLRAFDAAPEPA